MLRAILRRLFEPLSLILLAAGIVSVVTGDAVGGAIIVAILTLSIGLDTFQEGHARRPPKHCGTRWHSRRGQARRRLLGVQVDQVVPGDILRVRAGDIIPADALVIESTAFTAAEAALTGEPYPVEKRPGLADAASPGEASNALFRGAVASTGEAIALVVATGRATMFGAAASALAEAQAPSPFQRDLREFGLVVARLTLGLVVAVLTVRVVSSAGRARLAHVRRRARGRPHARAAADDHDGDALARGPAHGAAEGHRETPGRDPRPRRDDGALHRQDRHADLGRDRAGAQPRPGGGRGRPAGAACGHRRGSRRRPRLARRRPGRRAAECRAGVDLAGRRAFDLRRRTGSVLAAGPKAHS